MHFSSHPCMLHVHSSHSYWFDSPSNICWSVEVIKLLTLQSFHVSHIFLCLHSKYSHQAACSQTRSVHVLPLVWEIKFHSRTKQEGKLYFFVLKFWSFIVVARYLNFATFSIGLLATIKVFFLLYSDHETNAKFSSFTSRPSASLNSHRTEADMLNSVPILHSLDLPNGVF